MVAPFLCKLARYSRRPMSTDRAFRRPMEAIGGRALVTSPKRGSASTKTKNAVTNTALNSRKWSSIAILQ
jgi:hypothetical protein